MEYSKQKRIISQKAKDFFDNQQKSKSLNKQLKIYLIGYLDEPFGDQFDAALQKIIDLLPNEYKFWVARKISHNRDLASFLTSINFFKHYLYDQ